MIQQINDFIKYSNFSVVDMTSKNDKFFHFKVTSKDFKVSGYGSCNTISGAQTKALYEMIERFVFQKYSESSDATSSGWAAQTTVDLSRLNAKKELIERDVLMCSWLLKVGPLQIIREAHGILNTKAVQIFSKEPNLSVVGCFISNNRKKIYISCCADNAEASVEKLQYDSERAIKILDKNNSFASSTNLSKHFLAVQDVKENDLEWFNHQSNGIKIVDSGYEYTDYQVNLWDGTIVWVSKVVNKNLQKLFWGEQFFRNLNRKRLRSIAVNIKINRMLHPFL